MRPRPFRVVSDDLSTLPDGELVPRARAGDDLALEALVDRHHGMVYGVAMAILRDPEEAADTTQETFLKVVRALGSFRGEASFRTWLATVAANEARSMLRRAGRRPRSPLEDAGRVPDSGPDPSERAETGELAEKAHLCLEKLPEKQRMAVWLRVFEGLSFREVGEVIDSSEGAARVNYHHGIRRLREMME